MQRENLHNVPVGTQRQIKHKNYRLQSRENVQRDRERHYRLRGNRESSNRKFHVCARIHFSNIRLCCSSRRIIYNYCNERQTAEQEMFFQSSSQSAVLNAKMILSCLINVSLERAFHYDCLVYERV